MRLFSGAPYWLVLNGLDHSSVTAPPNCDVAIIGAGVTGALLADSLTAAGFTVTVLDRRRAAEGSTAACTGIITYELDMELGVLSTLIGEPFAVRSYKACARAIENLAALVATLPDDCGFVRRRSLYLARRRGDSDRLIKEAELRTRHGLDVSHWTREQVAAEYRFPSYGALHTSAAASVDPVRLTRALLERAQSAGATVCPRTHVHEWTSTPHGVQLVTSRGLITASWVIFAMGYEAPPGLRDALVDLNSTYALATFPVDGTGDATQWNNACMVWDTDRPYTYLRIAEEGRVVIGGADAPFKSAVLRDAVMPRKTRDLERRRKELLPATEMETEFAWAGTFGETRDSLPCIGPHAGMPRALFALGYGGNGIVFSMLAARILRGIVLGEGDEDAELFTLERGSNKR